MFAMYLINYIRTYNILPCMKINCICGICHCIYLFYMILLNICVVTGRANITYYERSQSVIKLRAAYHRAIIGLIK